jgi:hypothetical protein
MEQLRTALTWLQKYHFWVLSVLVLAIAIFCWKVASAKLTKTFEANQSAIQAKFNSVKTLRNDPFHPNEDVNTKQAEQTTTQAKSVGKLWQQVYDLQREKVLKWPEELNKDFIAEVEKLQFGADIRPSLRTYYQNYVNLHFPALPKQIDARKGEFGPEAGGTNRPGGGGPEGAAGPVFNPSQLADESDYTCEWLESDQKFIYDELYMQTQPSKLKIWVTQEDLWVYHTLLEVIARTNKAAGATRMSNAAVKTVGELAVGLRAGRFSRTPNRLLWRASAAPNSGAPPGENPAGPGPEGGPPPGGATPQMEFRGGSPGGSGGAQTEAQEQVELLSGRYLNADGKPIPFGAGSAPAADGTPADPNAPPQAVDPSTFGLEYKRLPVRMVLRMDQRWLQYLITECANQPLQVEVQEVRVNPGDITGLSASEGPSSRNSAGPGGGGAFVFPDEPTQQTFSPHPEIANVVIQGVIYIFNKPKMESLQPPGEQQPTTVAEK